MIIDIPFNLVNSMINAKFLGNVQCHMCSRERKKRGGGREEEHNESCQYTFIAPDAVPSKLDTFVRHVTVGTATEVPV